MVQIAMYPKATAADEAAVRSCITETTSAVRVELVGGDGNLQIRAMVEIDGGRTGEAIHRNIRYAVREAIKKASEANGSN